MGGFAGFKVGENAFTDSLLSLSAREGIGDCFASIC